MNRETQGAGRRVLALDVRPHKLGYAVFEAPERLLDIGITRFDSPHAGLRRVTALIARFNPITVVLRKIAKRSTRNHLLTRAVVRLISRQVRHSSIEVAVVSNRQVRASLGGDRTLTRHQIASLLTSTFPELEWKLPPPRKTWQPESWNMLLFDAVAIGVTYLAFQNDASAIQKLVSC